MPSGLASWLDDDTTSRKCKLPPTAREAPSKKRRSKSKAQLASDMDVDAASPDAAGASGGSNNLVRSSAGKRARGESNNLLRASAGKPAWDPFSSNNHSSSSSRLDAREDAFARLRQGAAAAKQQPASSTNAASTPSPPTWRRDSPPSSSSSWDPFGSTADGKENRGNAFSKLLAAPSQQHSSQNGRSLFDGGSGKKTKLSASVPPTPLAAGVGGMASEAEAETRFCECPVCGKRVSL